MAYASILNSMSNFQKMNVSKDLRSVISENVKEDSEHVTNPTAEEKGEVKNEVSKNEQLPETNQPEVFSEKIDTKEFTPQELEETYKKYQKAYTQKRQKEKEEMRQMQEELERYRQASTQPNTTNHSKSDIQQEQKEVQRQYDLGKMSLEDYSKTMRQLASEDARRIAKEEFENLSKQNAETSNQEQLVSRFLNLDKRFDSKFIDPESPEYNEVNRSLYSVVSKELDKALSDYLKANGTSLGFEVEPIAIEAIKRFDNGIEALIKNRLLQSTKNAQMKADSLSKSNPKGITSKSIPTSVRDLRELISSNLTD